MRMVLSNQLHFLTLGYYIILVSIKTAKKSDTFFCAVLKKKKKKKNVITVVVVYAQNVQSSIIGHSCLT